MARNIIGIRKGTTHPDRYIVVAGHYDSWYAGANDNCTAVGTLLSIVEANKDVAPAYTMIYIGWDAEEPGLVGSYEWIRPPPGPDPQDGLEHQPRGDRDRDVPRRRADRAAEPDADDRLHLAGDDRR